MVTRSLRFDNSATKVRHIRAARTFTVDNERVQNISYGGGVRMCKSGKSWPGMNSGLIAE